MKIPGFVDLQINGYKGISFSSLDLTLESFVSASRELLSTGTAVFMPTIITSSKEVYTKNLKIMAEAIDKCFTDSIPGIHLEGPFISDKPGAVGAHPRQSVCKASVDLLDELWHISKAKIKMITVAAEVENIDSVVNYALSKGIAVSLGHQMAGYNEIKKIHSMGAASITHLGNGMPNQVHRHNNQLIAALAIKKIKAMIITDGHHLPDPVIRAIFNAKDIQDIIVTSDASPIAGLKPGRYKVLGNDTVLEPDGLLHNPVKQCLVGSSTMMLDCINYLASLNICTVDQLVEVGFYNPLNLIAIDPSKVKSSSSLQYNKAENRFEICS